MSQTFTDDLYEQSYVADTTLTNMENNMAALKSSFSGGAAPSNPVAFMPWGDTTSGHEILKRRNDANDAWLAILCGDASQKMWIYRNDTCEGWVIDSAVTDRVIALKGGTDEYNINGGNTSAWTNWGHALTAAELPAHTHGIGVYGISGASGYQVGATATTSLVDTETSESTGSDNAHEHGRPGAAVGTLQYPDL